MVFLGSSALARGTDGGYARGARTVRPDPLSTRFLLDRLYNFHWIAPDAARSAQPWLGFYGAFLRAHGIRSVINLRGSNPSHRWWRNEGALCARLGIVHRDVQLSSRRLPPRSHLAALFDAFATPGPILFKCSGGQDRTSFACALYLLERGGTAARNAAAAQFSAWPYLHRPRANQRWLRLFPEFALGEAGGRPLGEWARTGYDPVRLAGWLVARGEGASFDGHQRQSPFHPEQDT